MHEGKLQSTMVESKSSQTFHQAKQQLDTHGSRKTMGASIEAAARDTHVSIPRGHMDASGEAAVHGGRIQEQ